MDLTIEILVVFLSLYYFLISLWLIRGISNLKAERNKQNFFGTQPKVSIIIAARNEQPNITALLEKCIAQNYPKDKFEIIVANDRSEDETANIIRTFSARHKNIKLINIEELPEDYEKSGKKHALKCGIEQSTGEILLLTDADCMPQPEWIRSIVKYFGEDTGVVVGHSPIKGDGFINRLVQLDNLSIIAIGAGGIGGGYPILSVGRNFAYRRQVYDEIGGFEEIKNFSSGDDDLLLMLVREKTDWKISFVSDPKSFVYTHPPNNLKTAIKQRMRWASKGLHYPILMTLSLIALFLYNLVLFVSLPLVLTGLIETNLPVFSFIFKILIDFLLIYQTALLVREKKLLKYYPLAAIFHIPYLLFFGLYGTFGEVKWKTD